MGQFTKKVPGSGDKMPGSCGGREIVCGCVAARTCNPTRLWLINIFSEKCGAVVIRCRAHACFRRQDGFDGPKKEQEPKADGHALVFGERALEF